MFDRNLKYTDSLKKVQSGENYVNASFSPPDLRQIKDGIELLDILVRTSALTKDGLYTRGRVFYGYKVLAIPPEEVTYVRAEWVSTERLANNFLAEEFHNRLIGVSQRPFHNMLLGTGFPFPIEDEVEEVMDEAIKNTAEHFDFLGSKGVWEVELHVSRSGVMVSTYQDGIIDPITDFERRASLPPDVTPSGTTIPRPRYWNDFGNGDGFIRGNGLAVMNETQAVRVNFRVEEEPFGPATRIFLYSEKHLKDS